LTKGLQELDFAKEVARDLGLIGMDICIMLYSSLKRQAERDKLPPLPKVSQSLAFAFIARLKGFMTKPPLEMSKILQRDPTLLRNIWKACDIYLEILEGEAEKAKLPREKREELPVIAYSAFGLACGLYELLEEAEEVEELTKLLRK